MQLEKLIGLTFAALVVATIIGQILRRTAPSPTTANVNTRIVGWWVLCGVTAAALELGELTTLVLFAIFSALALREFAALIPVHWIFYSLVPLQYGLIWTRHYAAFLLLLPALALAARSAKVYVALIVSIYLFSYAPALFLLGRSAALLFYLLLIVELSDVFQYIWGKLLGRTKIAPHISPNKTWEGLAGGVLTSTALGVLLYRATPFSPIRAAVVCLTITLAGFCGGLVLSSIKRSAGIKDFGAIVPGHGGVLDRIDSLCFSAPVFFHLTRYLTASNFV